MTVRFWIISDACLKSCQTSCRSLAACLRPTKSHGIAEGKAQRADFQCCHCCLCRSKWMAACFVVAAGPTLGEGLLKNFNGAQPQGSTLTIELGACFCIHQPCVVVWLFRSCPNISWNLLTWPTFPCWKQWTRQTNCTAHWRCSRTNSWAMKGGVWWDCGTSSNSRCISLKVDQLNTQRQWNAHLKES